MGCCLKTKLSKNARFFLGCLTLGVLFSPASSLAEIPQACQNNEKFSSAYLKAYNLTSKLLERKWLRFYNCASLDKFIKDCHAAGNVRTRSSVLSCMRLGSKDAAATIIAEKQAHCLHGQEPPIVWNYNGQAVAKGDGCDSDLMDTFFIPAGKQLTVIFSNMGLDLAGHMSQQDKVRTCTLVIPVKINQGWCAGTFRQAVFYGWTKSGKASAKLTVRTKLENRITKAIDEQITQDDEDMVPYAEATAEETFSSGELGGPGGAITKRFIINFTVLGQVKKPTDSIVFQVDGDDMGLELFTTAEWCGQ